MKHLVEFKTFADIIYSSKEVDFSLRLRPIVFTETAPKLREMGKIMVKFKNSPIFFQKTYIQS